MTLGELVERYRADRESVYNTWFIGGEERLKAFRSIRRGVRDTVESIARGQFGNDFKGSPLETVLKAITEQKEVFEGAAHPFFWKPKLRIPDIYENERNQRRFGSFLESCLAVSGEDEVLAELSCLAGFGIKGLGPAVANIIYFLHPTVVPPFNTAMVKGFNALFQARKKLGSWQSYLEMRETIVEANDRVRDRLSKDLGAFAGLLYEIGAGRLVIRGNAEAVLHGEKARAEKIARARHAKVVDEEKESSEHERIQYLLIKIGRALKYDVHVARNDRHRAWQGESFSLLTLPKLPPLGLSEEVADTVSLIDVLWLKPGTAEVVSAFEVEKTTSIFSGILRLEDLARSLPGTESSLYLVAPNDREREVMAQLSRPAFSDGPVRHRLGYIPFGQLCENCEALCRFGEDHTVLKKIARERPQA